MRATRILTGAEAARVILDIASRAERIDVALAWATLNPVSEWLLDSGKVSKAVIGTHLYATDPRILRRLALNRSARVVPPDAPRLFHPKVYLFEAGDAAYAVVGSHNLTNRAFAGDAQADGNDEASVLLKGSRESATFSELRAFVDSAWNSGKTIDEAFLFSYELQHADKRARWKELENELASFARLQKPLLGRGGLPEISPLDLSWQEFVRRTRLGRFHDFSLRLQILEFTRSLFVKKKHFSEFLPEERKAVAGTYQPEAKGTLLGYDWAWFGSMGAFGGFASLVNRSPEGLSRAMDCIPIEGEVTRDEFDAFCAQFRNAFNGSERVGRYPVASRLLAMKRPDQFVAVNSQNLKGLTAGFGMRKSKLSLENYWECIVLPLRLSPFWQSARPQNADGGVLWDARAAMLDAIYYEGLQGQPSRSVVQELAPAAAI